MLSGIFEKRYAQTSAGSSGGEWAAMPPTRAQRFEVADTLATLRGGMRGAAMQTVFDAIETGSLTSDAA